MKDLSRMRITAATAVIKGKQLLVFGPNGEVFFCAIKYPGSWSDGNLMAHFYNHIKERIGDCKICVKQSFL
jgi:hypothetical protein